MHSYNLIRYNLIILDSVMPNGPSVQTQHASVKPLLVLVLPGHAVVTDWSMRHSNHKIIMKRPAFMLCLCMNSTADTHYTVL